MVASHVTTYGPSPKEWPAPALASVQRRHDWLIAMTAQRIGLVPKDLFFPLGRQSRRLLRPGAALRVARLSGAGGVAPPSHVAHARSSHARVWCPRTCSPSGAGNCAGCCGQVQYCG